MLDVGTNTGFYSLVAVMAHPSVRVVAYEPVPEIVTMLHANVAANPQGRRVEIRQVAVSDRTGTATLHLPPPQADGTVETSASVEGDFKDTIQRTFEVASETLDTAWRAAGQPSVSIVKIDVEGAEHRVLAEPPELVEASRPT